MDKAANQREKSKQEVDLTKMAKYAILTLGFNGDNESRLAGPSRLGLAR